MDDLISRRAAIDALNSINCFGWVEDSWAKVSGIIEHVPSAQPYTDEEIQKIQELEQAEIEKAFQLGREDALSEIIRCKECNHHKDEEPGMVYCPIIVGGWVKEDCFCSYGERREDG